MSLEKHILTIDNIQYVLPVPPSSWEVQGSNNAPSVNLLGFGEMNTGSQPNLRTASISSLFSLDNLGFVKSTEFKDRYEYIKAIQNAKDKGTVIQYQITDTNIYMDCIITSFSYGEQDYTGDIYYTLELKENKRIELVDINDKVEAQGYVQKDSIYPYFYTVKDGDTITTICKKAYGDTSSEKIDELLSKNNLLNPSEVKTGVILQL